MSFNLQRLNEISKPDKTWKRKIYRAVNKKKLKGIAAIIVAELRRKADENT